MKTKKRPLYIKHDLLRDQDAKVYEQSDLGMVPKSDRWAFEHIMAHDCGSVSCGKAVYQIEYV